MKSLFIYALLMFTAHAAQATEKLKKPQPKVHAELVTETQAINSKLATWLALVLTPEPGWHVYWKNPGDTGNPAQIKLKNSTQFTLGEILWPIPETFKTGDLLSFGYDKQVVLPFSLESQSALTEGASYTLEFEARWLTCKDVCIPERQSFTLTLKVIDNAKNQPGSGTQIIHQAIQNFPVRSADWKLEGRYPTSGDQIELTATPKFLAPLPNKDFEVFVESRDVIQYDKPTAVEVAAGNQSIRIRLTARKQDAERPENLSLILIHKNPWQTAVEKMSRGVAFTFHMQNARVTPSAPASSNSLLQMLFFALMGGLLLNLMPCVFPVLSLKAFGLVHDTGRSPRSVRLHGLAFTVGVLLSFWILAAVLALLQKAGAQVGWGFQLQSPKFVALMIYLFFVLGLNLAGVFEFGSSLMNLGGKLSASSPNDGVLGALLTGVLSVIVASPCTAPFMGVALGFAISQSSIHGFLIFTSLGLGLALPFLTLSFFPALASGLPKPGAWMETFKNCLSIPLFGSVAWLVWVLGLQSQNAGAVLAGLFIVGGALWFYGQRVQPGATPQTRKKALAALTLALILINAIAAPSLFNRNSNPNSADHKSQLWEPYSRERLAQLRAKATPVLVDYTAAWCITCLVNERVALNTDQVQRELHEKGVITLRADWTSEDPIITQDLKSFERSGVPLYLLYPKNSLDPPQILPQILTPGVVIEALHQL